MKTINESYLNTPTVVYTISDVSYYDAAVSMASILNTYKGKKIKFVLIYEKRYGQNISFEIFNRAVRKYKRNIEVDIELQDISNIFDYNFFTNRIIPYYFRLYIPFVCKNRQVLYLDADTMLEDDISPLLDIELTDDEFAAGTLQKESGRGYADYVSEHNLPFEYLSTGVVLMNLDALRENLFFEKVQEIYRSGIRHISCLINICINGHIKRLPLKYHVGRNVLYEERYPLILDYFTEEDIQNALLNPVIVHWSLGGHKPDTDNTVYHYDVWKKYLDSLTEIETVGTEGNPSVVYVISNVSWELASVSFASLIDNYEGDSLEVTFIYDVSRSDLIDFDKLNQISKEYNHNNIDIHLNFYDISPYFDYESFTGSIEEYYFRLYLPTILKSNQVLYLDADTLIEGDISSLLNTKLPDSIQLAGVKQLGCSVGFAQWLKDNNKTYQYISSGVCLINLDNARKINYLEDGIKYKNEFGYISVIINMLAIDQIQYIPLKYHVGKHLYNIEKQNNISAEYSSEEIKNAYEHPVIIHWSDNHKPNIDNNCFHYNKWYTYYKNIFGE